MTKSTHSPATMRQTTDINHPDTVVAARYQSAIGVDVHASILVCAYQDGTHPESIKTEHLSFGTKYSEIEAFAQWCKQRNPDVIVMESTGVLWRSAYEALENLHTILARHHYSDDVLLKMVSLGILKGIVIAEKDYMPGVALKIYEAEGHLNDMLLKYF